MKALFLSILSIALISAAMAGEIKREFDVKSGGTLEADIRTGGSLFVTGWDKEKVEIIVHYRGRTLDDEVQLEIQERNGDIIIDATAESNTNANLEFEIKAPLKFNLDMNTMGGQITVENLQGNLKGETMGGQITLSQLKGKANFTTMGGKIELSDSDVDGKVSTMGGKVIFNNVVGDVDGSSMGGNVIYKNVRSRDGKTDTGKEVNISTMGGKIEVDEAMSGADVSTMGGKIYVKKAANYVKANTMGGNIEIEDIDGWVKATTMGGDVFVNMTGDPENGRRDVTLSSMGGNIELTLPEGISADFDIRLTYTRRSRQDYQIISDFKLDTEESDEWEYNNGDARKTIDGRGKSGSGKNLIKISTVNGDIRIKKGK